MFGVLITAAAGAATCLVLGLVLRLSDRAGAVERCGARALALALAALMPLLLAALLSEWLAARGALSRALLVDLTTAALAAWALGTLLLATGLPRTWPRATRRAALHVMRTCLTFGIFVSIALSGCALASQSKPARAQETALELNLNARFGRMELAAEHVAEPARAAFFDKRKGWGTSIRVADYDMTGLRMLKNDEDCETTVRVAWFRAAENDLHTTTLKQKWHDFKGDWKLTEESRVDGDLGLLGEPPMASSAPTPGARRPQFQSITLGTGNTTNLGVTDLPPATPPPPAAMQQDPGAEYPKR